MNAKQNIFEWNRSLVYHEEEISVMTSNISPTVILQNSKKLLNINYK